MERDWNSISKALSYLSSKVGDGKIKYLTLEKEGNIQITLNTLLVEEALVFASDMVMRFCCYVIMTVTADEFESRPRITLQDQDPDFSVEILSANLEPFLFKRENEDVPF